MFYQFAVLATLAVYSLAIPLDFDFMTSDDLERYFNVRTLEEVPEYEIVDPVAYSAGGRHRRAIEVKESTKEIKLQAFGEEFHMKLEENTQLIADGLQVDVHHKDGTVTQLPLTAKNCHYHGKLESREVSTVAVSTCDGLTGMIATETEDFFINPLSDEHKEKYRRRRRDVQNPHVIYRRSSARDDNDTFCGLDSDMYPIESLNHTIDMETMHNMHLSLAPPPQELIRDDNMTYYYYDMDEYDTTMEPTVTDYDTTMEPTVTDEFGDEDQDDKGRRGDGGHGGGHGGSGSGGKGRAGDDSSSSRKRRQSNSATRYLEVRVLADKDMNTYHTDVITYTLTLMNIVAARFKDVSLGRTIIVHIVRIGALESDNVEQKGPNGVRYPLNVRVDGPSTLGSWSEFAYRTNTWWDEASPGHYDNAVLITRKNLEVNRSPNLLGIAWGNATCYWPRAASVNQDQGLSSGIVIAHEIGHTLGMNHDNDNGCQNGVNVMSSHRPNGARSFQWSRCSVVDLNRFLSDRFKSCLNDRPSATPAKEVNADDRPGATLSADEQCRLQSTNRVTYIDSCTRNLAGICANLFCRTPNGGCSSSVAAAEGTFCGDGKWCISGECVPKTGGSNNNYLWRIYSEGQCSVTCGTGAQTQVYRCSVSQTQFVDDSLCNPSSKPTSQSRQCFAGVCPTRNNWSRVPGSCSVTCGQGTRTDVITCISGSGQIRPDSECDLSNKPTPRTRSCNEADCPQGAYWLPLRFGPCSVTCGSGIQTRSVLCVVNNGQNLNQVADSQCDQPRPATTQTCTAPTACTHGVWVTSAFSQCSVTCGGGTRTRTVTCRSSTTSPQILNDSQCSGTKPHTTENCNTSNCPFVPTGVWVTSTFSQCSVTCGGGTRRRTVTCRSSTTSTQILNDSQCRGTKPHTTENCNTSDCPSTSRYTWFETPQYEPCSVTCGTGTQSTQVICVDNDRLQTVDILYCDINTRPQPVTRTCHNSPCPSASARWQTGSYSECSVSCGEGTQRRSVTCIIPTSYGNAQVSDQCDLSTKPSDTRTCSEPACPTPDVGEWATTAFSQCSVTCGQGTQQANVYCRSTTTQATIANSKCDPQTRPSNTRTCNPGACPTNNPDQGVPCGGLWTRPVSNLNRFSISNGGQICKESFVAQPGQQINITFHRCYIPPAQGLQFPFLVRDFHETDNYTCLSNLDSSGNPYELVSQSHIVQFEYPRLPNQGYVISVEFIGQPSNGCDRVLTGPSGTVTSPNYPSNYPRRQSCRTAVVAPPGMKVQMSYQVIQMARPSPSWPTYNNLDCSETEDNLSVFDLDTGRGYRSCGTSNNPATEPQPNHQNRVLIQFTSNNDIFVDKGFEINYTFVNA